MELPLKCSSKCNYDVDSQIARLSFSQIKSWVALSFLVGCLYYVLDHTNHTFSESLWHPLSTDPLTTHPSPTQTHQTHQTHKEPTLPDHFSTLWRSTPYKQNIFWNLMTPSFHWLTDHSPITYTDPQSPPYGLLSLAQFTLSSLKYALNSTFRGGARFAIARFWFNPPVLQKLSSLSQNQLSHLSFQSSPVDPEAPEKHPLDDKVSKFIN